MKTYHLRILLFLLSLCVSVRASAQVDQTTIDSLKILLKTAPSDTNKIRLYGNLSWYYASTRSKTDSARIYADSTMLLSRELEFLPGEILAHFYYGNVNRHEGNFRDALNHLQIYVDYHRERGNEHNEATGLYQIGVVENNLGNYEQSLEAYQRVVTIHKKNRYWYGVGFTVNGIGIIYKTLKKYDDAISAYQEALSIFEEHQHETDRAFVLTNLGNVYGELEDYQSSMEYHKMALELYQQLKLDSGIAASFENIGNIYNRLGNYDRALPNQLNALEIRRNLPGKRSLATSLNKVGYTYLKRQNSHLAEQFLQEALVLVLQLETKPIIRDVYENLAELRAQQANHGEALEYYKLFTATKDSILNEESSKQINELQAKYETAIKNEEIATLTKENELSEMEARRRAVLNRGLTGGLILLTIISGLVVFILRQRFKNQQLVAAKNEELNTSRFKQQLSDLEMKALRAQMNPHFIFNSMNSINRMILSGDNDHASLYLTKFSKLIRLMLQNSEHQTVRLEDELAMLETYIQLENMRFKGKISYRISIDEGIDKANTLVPSMVLQPFIENAIWHGLMHKEGEGFISITIGESGDVLRCVIEDNGVGREKALELQEKTVLNRKSMGLQITEERLSLLNRKELRQLIRITDLKDPINRAAGTRVDINIPIA